MSYRISMALTLITFHISVLGYVISNFDGYNNISYQCLDQEEIQCEEKDVEDTLTTAEQPPKKNAFSLMMSKKELCR